MTADTKVAVGVVVPIGVLALLGAFLCIFIRRRKAQANTTAAPPEELGGNQINHRYAKYRTKDEKVVPVVELEAGRVHELG